MFDEDILFDTDDKIIIKNNSIILVKKHDNIQNQIYIQNKLKELDGKWQIEIDDSSTVDKSSCEDWISEHYCKLFSIFHDIKEKSVYIDIFQLLTFSKLTYFLEEQRHTPNVYHDNAENFEEYKLFGMKNPNLNEWTSFFIIDLFLMFNEYNKICNLGPLDTFIKFVFNNSITKKLPNY